MREIHRVLYSLLLGLGLAVCLAMVTQWHPFVNNVDGKTVAPAKNKKDYVTTSLKDPVGSILPDASVETLDGKPFTLSKNMGQPVMLVFFASWCTPCRLEMAQLNNSLPSLENNHIKVIGVDVISSELTKRDVQKFTDKNQLKFPVILDIRDQLDIPLNVHTIPVSFLFNKKGKLIDKKEGPVDIGDLHHFIEQVK